MEQHTIFILILLLQCILDALGDGFRARGWQRIHHFDESLQLSIWLGLIAAVSPLLGWLEFEWYYLLMYLFGRIWLFDLVINLVRKKNLFYVGQSSIDGVIYHFIAGTYRKKHRFPVELVSFIVKFMALIGWVAMLLTDGGMR